MFNTRRYQGHFDFRGWSSGIKERVKIWNRRRLYKRRFGREGGLHSRFMPRNIIDLSKTQPSVREGVTVAVQLHLYYADLIRFFVPFLKRIPVEFDLYVSCSGDVKSSAVESVYSSLPKCRKVIARQVLNVGRDVAPLLCEFSDELIKYDLIAHIHGKKSLYNGGATTGWLEYLCEGLFPVDGGVSRIFELLLQDDPCGIVYPLNCHVLPYQANTWLANKGRARNVALKIGLNEFPETYFDYPAGSMFWARSDALKKLLAHGFKYDDFDQELGQTDGTLAHAVERLFGLVAKDAGYRIGVLQDQHSPSWSAWRLDGYFGRSAELGYSAVSSDKVSLVAFDVFDTLLCRPLLDPEMIKDLVAHAVNPGLGRKFLENRVHSENEARKLAGRDVGLFEVYETFKRVSGCSETECQQLRALEEQFEVDSLYPRPDGVALLQAALRAGKSVVLISDMFLSKKIITSALQRYGILGWGELYVSSEVGVRKDSGALYRHVMAERGVSPDQMLMVGDSERSDWQIPTDMGMNTFHFLRAVDTARAKIRFAPVLEAIEAERDKDEHLTLGLVVQGEYSPVFYENHSSESLVDVKPFSVGRGILGPLVASFSEWLVRSNQQKQGVKLFFLAREGQALKMAYDAWVRGVGGDAPTSDYLVLSRRCVNVAAIRDFNDIVKIAKSDFFKNTAALFLMERYGVALDEGRWRQVKSKIGWSADKVFEIKGGDVSEVSNLLQEIQVDIYRQAEAERPPLLNYLSGKGVLDCPDPVLVDVGYSGTIQSSLNRLLGMAIRGQYMATDTGSEGIYPLGKKNAEGYFADNVKRSPSAPFVLRESFLLEKLLSSDDAQVVNYGFDAGGNIFACHKVLSSKELAVRGIRAEVRAGMLSYIDAATDVRRKLKHDFWPSASVANALYEHYVANSSEAELAFAGRLVLDDYYCGRGLVS